jgi:hypothetical protein
VKRALFCVTRLHKRTIIGEFFFLVLFQINVRALVAYIFLIVWYHRVACKKLHKRTRQKLKCIAGCSALTRSTTQTRHVSDHVIDDRAIVTLLHHPYSCRVILIVLLLIEIFMFWSNLEILQSG